MLLIKAFPHGEGGSCVPRKHETDEGVIFPIQPVPPPLHQSGSHGGYRWFSEVPGDCDRRESMEGATPATIFSGRLGVLSC